MASPAKTKERFWKFRDVAEGQWRNWKWQVQNSLTGSSDIREFFPNLSEQSVKDFNQYVQHFKIRITPHTLSLIELDEDGNPRETDPIWRQVRFFSMDELDGDFEYDGQTKNWEMPEEMITGFLHRKYPDRAIIRLSQSCLGYCSYCYLTDRVLDKEQSGEAAFNREEWRESLDYLESNPEIRDVIISGGDPLLLSNTFLEGILEDLRGIPSIKTIRLNTRMVTFNPFRIEPELTKILKEYSVNTIEIHAAHPREITPEFDDALSVFEECNYNPVILWRAPLLKGVNNSYDVLEELLMKVYQRNILPYYLFHCAPYTLGRSNYYGCSIREGIELLSKMRRRIPGPAFPRYTLFHYTGKVDIPLEKEGTSEFRFIEDEDGNPFVKFKNWKGDWVTYPDIKRTHDEI